MATGTARPLALTGVLAAAPTVRVIEPSEGWAPLRLDRIWRYRGLLYFLAWRDIKVRYKQTVLGVAWAVLQPVLTMAIFAVVFGRVVGVKTGSIPYPLFAFTAPVSY